MQERAWGMRLRSGTTKPSSALLACMCAHQMPTPAFSLLADAATLRQAPPWTRARISLRQTLHRGLAHAHPAL